MLGQKTSKGCGKIHCTVVNKRTVTIARNLVDVEATFSQLVDAEASLRANAKEAQADLQGSRSRQIVIVQSVQLASGKLNKSQKQSTGFVVAVEKSFRQLTEAWGKNGLLEKELSFLKLRMWKVIKVRIDATGLTKELSR